jgi:hypothetical protein
VVEANFIGTDAVGDNRATTTGIQIDGAANHNRIGGTTYGLNTVGFPNNTIGFNISANTIGFNTTGVSIAGTKTTANLVEGNFIGTNAAASNLGNGTGIVLSEDPGNSIGGTTFGSANVIGFNTTAGILINGAGNDLVRGNYIGTDQYNDKMGNALGIWIDNSSGNSIGGTVNPTITGTVSGTNAAANLFPAWATESVSYSGTGTLGVPIAGTASETGLGNVIGFNQGAGVSISGTSTGNVMMGNLIGVNWTYQRETGDGPQLQNAGNLGDGVDIDGGDARSNSIGSPLSASPSIGGTIGSTVSTYNVLGYSNVQSLPQQTFGAKNPFLSSNTAVGNIITANGGDGVSIVDSPSNLVAGNLIGATSSLPGSAPGSTNSIVGNAGNGISVLNALNNTIGSAALDPSVVPPTSIVPLDGAANIVSGNVGDGISVSSGGTTLIAGNLVSFNTKSGIHYSGELLDGALKVTIVNNLVGTTIGGSSTVDPNNGVPQGNGLDGIRLDQTGPSTPVSGTAAMVWNNVSSHNGLSGIDVETSGSGVSYAGVSIFGNYLGTDITGRIASGPSKSSPGQVVPFGNALDGILLSEVLGVTVGGTATGQGNVVSGNLGRGIEIRGDNVNLSVDGMDLIQDNIIGLDASGEIAVANSTSLGNLSDGIYLQDPGKLSAAGVTRRILIQDNTISNNHGAGIHAFADSGILMSQDGLMITGNKIGTDPLGTTVEVTDPSNRSLLDSLGNGSDGVFLDGISTTDTTAELVKIADNVISGNHADGIDLLKSSRLLITDNKIGVNVSGGSAVGNAQNDFGNASNGVFINQSADITIGGTTGDPSRDGDNIISGNHSSGVFISGTNPATGGKASASNQVLGNWIGVGFNVNGQTVATPNAVAGVILSNADSNTIGGSGSAYNVISGNSLDGILLVNDATGNKILNNRIGTDPSAMKAISNSADGVFLLGSTEIAVKDVPQNTTPSTISGNTIDGNIMGGNNQDGIQVFGAFAMDNTFTGNWIGLTPGGTQIGNGADGVLLNKAGPANTVGGTTSAARNIISDNAQAGVEITGSPLATQGTVVEGNDIGTDPSGTQAIGNGSSGVQIYGSSANTIGGTAAGAGNVISGNAQAGIQIFNPGGTNIKADNNQILGNLIGINAAGNAAVRNGSDGVQILNGSNNTIGGSSSADRNVISGNAGNGVTIVQFPGLSASGNLVQGNFIGTDAGGTARAGLGNQGSGVALIDGSANTIGGTGGATLLNTQVPSGGWLGNSPGNVISGNGQWGVLMQVTGAFTGTKSAVEGNVIGMDASGMSPLGNGQGGVFVNNFAGLVSASFLGQTIGGSAAGAGNLISGNANVGIELAGQQLGASGANNFVQGNLIGLDITGRVVNGSSATGNGIGILALNSPNNIIGGTDPNGVDRNVISGNGGSGVDLSGQFSTGDQVMGNFIGTNPAGNAFPAGSSEGSPAQEVGVLIDGASANAIGQLGVPNVISGNAIGVEIAGAKQNNGRFFGSGNRVVGNLIGTDASGTLPVSNLDLGVYVNNSQDNTIGPGNVLSANGIAGVEILSPGSQSNLVSGNIIGTGIGGQVFPRGSTTFSSNSPEPGITVFADAQLNGVVIIGSSRNTIGIDRRIPGSAPNTIVGNVQVGVYITSRDFNGVRYALPTVNAVSGNTIRSNGVYGVLLYNAPNNLVRPYTTPGRSLVANRFGGQKVSFRNFQSGFDVNTGLLKRLQKGKHRARATHVVHLHKASRARLVTNAIHPVGATHLLHRTRTQVKPLHESKAGR